MGLVFPMRPLLAILLRSTQPHTPIHPHAVTHHSFYILSLTCVFLCDSCCLFYSRIPKGSLYSFLATSRPVSQKVMFIVSRQSVSRTRIFLFCLPTLRFNFHGSLYLYGASSKSVSLVRCCLSNSHSRIQSTTGISIWVL